MGQLASRQSRQITPLSQTHSVDAFKSPSFPDSQTPHDIFEERNRNTDSGRPDTTGTTSTKVARNSVSREGAFDNDAGDDHPHRPHEMMRDSQDRIVETVILYEKGVQVDLSDEHDNPIVDATIQNCFIENARLERELQDALTRVSCLNEQLELERCKNTSMTTLLAAKTHSPSSFPSSSSLVMSEDNLYDNSVTSFLHHRVTILAQQLDAEQKKNRDEVNEFEKRIHALQKKLKNEAIQAQVRIYDLEQQVQALQLKLKLKLSQETSPQEQEALPFFVNSQTKHTSSKSMSQSLSQRKAKAYLDPIPILPRQEQTSSSLSQTHLIPYKRESVGYGTSRDSQGTLFSVPDSSLSIAEPTSLQDQVKKLKEQLQAKNHLVLELSLQLQLDQARSLKSQHHELSDRHHLQPETTKSSAL